MANSYEICNALAACCETHYPHLRFMQFMDVFQHWIECKKERISFYVNDDELLKMIEEFSATSAK